MPVPPVPGLQVAPDEAPASRMQEQMPLAAAGGGAIREAISTTSDQLNEHIGRAVELETMKANQIVASNAEAMATQIVNKHIYGDGTPENPGFVNQKGGLAINAAGPTMEKIKDDLGKLHDSMPNDDVARILLRHTNELMDHANGQIQGTVMKQRDLMLSQAHEENVNTQIRTAYNTAGTPDMVPATKQAWDAGINEIKRFGTVKYGVSVDAQGNPVETAPGEFKPAAETEMELQSFKEKFVAAHVNALLESKDPQIILEAQSYLKTPEASEAMSKNPEVARHLSDTVNTSVVRDVTAPDKAREIVNSAILSGDGKGAALIKTEGLSDDYKYKSEVRRNISEYFDDHEKYQRDKQEQSDDVILHEMFKNGGHVPPGVSAESAPAYQRAYDRQMSGARLKSDSGTLFALKDMANSTNPKDQLDFTKENLRDPEYVGKLSPADLKALQTKQAELRKAFGPGGRTPNSDTSYRAQTEIAFQTMAGMGMDPNAPKGSPGYDRVVDFRSKLDETIKQMADLSGGKVDHKTMQNAATLVAANMAQENRNVVRSTGLTSTAAAAEIPKDDYDRWAAKLIKNKQPVTDKNIMYLYLRQLNAQR